MGHFLPIKEQGHNIYAVVDFKVVDMEVNFGVGYGLTPGSDRWMTKMILSWDLDFGQTESKPTSPPRKMLNR